MIGLDLKVKEQYSYFIYPFYINHNEYEEFILSLLEKGDWDFRVFNSIDDQKTASFFLPDVRKALFPTLNWSKERKEEFENYNNKKKAKKIAALPKATFEFKVKKPYKSSLHIKKNGIIDFYISKIMMITFERGTGLLIFKTILDEKDKNSFNKILDFNYTFREINMFHEDLKLDITTLHCERFKEQKTLSHLIIHLLNNFINVERESVYYDRLFTYSYVCLDESEWNEEKGFDSLIYNFFKFKHILPGDFNSAYNEDFMKKDHSTYSRWNYSTYGFLKESGVVLGSASDSFNYNQLPEYFETHYFYIFIMAIYQRMMLLHLSRELAAGETKKISKLRAYLLKFTNISWFNQLTNSEQGMDIWKKWQKVFELPLLFDEVQREYTEYYEYNLAKGQDRINRYLVYVFVISLVFPGISLLIQLGILDTKNYMLRIFIIAALVISVLYYPAVATYRKFFGKH